jgi:hypothetical protein
MANYKKQYLNLYDPTGAVGTKFCIQQKTDECYISRADKKVRVYSTDFVVRKKEAILANEVDVSVFGKFDSLDSDISTGFASRDATISAVQAAAATLSNTVVSNKQVSDSGDVAETQARTVADTALASTATANKALQDAGFLSATSARASNKTDIEAKLLLEENARIAAISSV